MKKILYLHGYKGSTVGGSFNNLKQNLPEGYSIEALDYEPENPSKALNQIADYVFQNYPDIIIGNSLGGFYALLSDTYTPCQTRIIVNPCILPSEELPKLGDTEHIDYFKKLEKALSFSPDAESRLSLACCIGDKDELFGDKYKQFLKNYYGVHSSENIIDIRSGHHISSEGAKDIFEKALPILEANIKEIENYYK